MSARGIAGGQPALAAYRWVCDAEEAAAEPGRAGPGGEQPRVAAEP